jgi:hypothetical protein
MAGLRTRTAFGKPPEYSDAIIALAPGCSFGITLNDYSSIIWQDENPCGCPSEPEIIEKLSELQASYDAVVYRWQRYKKYLTVEEQLAQLWDDMNDGIIPGKETSSWFAYIQSVKEEHPKPTE